MTTPSKIKLANSILFLAALYNILWGAFVSLFPELLLFGEPPTTLMLIYICCIGMLVGVYGVAYYIASTDPTKYWPLVFTGFVGKALGPFGAVYYIYLGKLSTDFFLYVNLYNDIIWLLPFAWILWEVYKGNLEIKKEDKIKKSIHKKILGDSFEDLSPNLKRFHGSTKRIQLEGLFKIERGNSWITNLIANAGGLPKAAVKEKVSLEINFKEGKEYWNRKIGAKSISSCQWISTPYLAEKFGALAFHLNLEVENNCLLIKDVHASVFGIPFPPFFTPTVLASSKDTPNGIDSSIDIGLYPFGRLLKYSGELKILE